MNKYQFEAYKVRSYVPRNQLFYIEIASYEERTRLLYMILYLAMALKS